MTIELWLINPNREMCAEWVRSFSALPYHQVIQSRFEELQPHDCCLQTLLVSSS